MIKTKDVHVFASYQDNSIASEDFCDNINRVFPINTAENMIKSAGALMSDSIVKVYDKTEHLHMFQRLLTASQAQDEETNTKIRNILKNEGGMLVDKVYTEDELLAKAKELAEKIVAEKEESKELETTKQALADKEASIAAKEAELKATTEKLEAMQKAEEDRIAAEKKAEEDRKIEAEKTEAIKAQIEALKAANIWFENVAALETYLRSQETASFESFKNILSDAVTKTMEEKMKNMTPEEKKKMEEDMKKTKASVDSDPQKLVDDSVAVPNAVVAEGIDKLKSIFDACLNKKTVEVK